MKTRLCVSITEKTTEAVIAMFRRLPAEVSTVEVRFDSIADPDVERICRACRSRLIATCRPTRQGGAFSGEETIRLGVLRRALSAGADFVDIECDWFRQESGKLSIPPTCRRIISFHDFTGTPERPGCDLQPHGIIGR